MEAIAICQECFSGLASDFSSKVQYEYLSSASLPTQMHLQVGKMTSTALREAPGTGVQKTYLLYLGLLFAVKILKQ